MTFAQALVYFSREALVSLVRSWKVSLLAVLTIAVSLFLGGIFLLVSSNLETLVEQWREESQVVLYLVDGAGEEELDALHARLLDVGWVRGLVEVSSEEAENRFRGSFPGLADVLEGWGDDALPASLELTVDWSRSGEPAFQEWLDALATEPAVAMVDDDREWLAQVEAMVLVLRSLGLAVGVILLVTAIFTIGSVIRLTAYLYHEEIAVMRQVGATEFFIRGPFYTEGFFQGLAGGILAAAALTAAHALFVSRYGTTLVAGVLAQNPLGPTPLALLVALGAGAGLVGAVASLRRESLGQTAEMGAWSEPGA